MKNQDFEFVKFRNTVLVCPLINGQPYVVCKTIIEDIGLNYRSAHKQLKNNPRFGNYCVSWHSKTGKYAGYSYTCVPIRKVSAWLNSINVNKVSAKVRPILIEFQEHCDDALFDYWFGTGKTTQESIKKIRSVIERIAKYDRLIAVLRTETRRLKRKKADLDQVIYKSVSPELDFSTIDKHKIGLAS